MNVDYARLVSQEPYVPEGCPWYAKPFVEYLASCYVYLRIQTLALRIQASYLQGAFLLTDNAIAEHMLDSIKRPDALSSVQLKSLHTACEVLLKRPIASREKVRSFCQKIENLEASANKIRMAYRNHRERRRRETAAIAIQFAIRSRLAQKKLQSLQQTPKSTAPAAADATQITAQLHGAASTPEKDGPSNRNAPSSPQIESPNIPVPPPLPHWPFPSNPFATALRTKKLPCVEPQETEPVLPESGNNLSFSHVRSFSFPQVELPILPSIRRTRSASQLELPPLPPLEPSTPPDPGPRFVSASPLPSPEAVQSPLPLGENESLSNLWKPGNTRKLREYKKQIEALTKFEKRLRAEGREASDALWGERLDEANEFFTRDYERAKLECAALHEEFKRRFPAPPPASQEEGNLLCTAAQWQWVIETLSTKFPALYHLAFEAPSRGIDQPRKVEALARLLLLGPDAGQDDLPGQARLREADGRAALAPGGERRENLLRSGSFIYTHIAENQTAKSDPPSLRRLFEGVAAAYIKDWLDRSGERLKFGTHLLRGGLAASADWVAKLRDHYRTVLLNMDRETLCAEIGRLTACPLIQLLQAAYPEQGALFSRNAMQKMFESALKAAEGNPARVAAIQKTIDDAAFAQEDLRTLSQRSGLPSEQIEPLLRIRVLYLMGCLSQTTIEPVVRGINERAKGLCDAEAEIPGPILVCDSSEERLLSFDDRLEQLEIEVKTVFKDLGTQKKVAEGKTRLSISSITDPRKEEVTVEAIDLQALTFNLYASQATCEFLIAQLNPQYFIHRLGELDREIAGSPLLKKTEAYLEAKRAHAASWLGTVSYFDPAPHRKNEEDARALRTLLQQISSLTRHLSTATQLYRRGQLSLSDLTAVEKRARSCLESGKEIEEMLDALYPDDPSIASQQKNQIALLKKRFSVLDNWLRIVVALGRPEERVGDPSSPAPGWGIGALAYDYTAGWVLGETPEKKYLKWKIERFEALIKEFSRSVQDFFANHPLEVLAAAEIEDRESIDHLLSLFACTRKSLRAEEERLDPAYLDAVRKVYQNEFVLRLRNAAAWSKEHQDSPNARHVDALCYRFYAAFDLNSTCRDVLETFRDFGAEALQASPAEPNPLTANRLYLPICNLETRYRQIHAAPNAAKAPNLAKWANSARGHLNGVYGVADFDPNLQSNPTHAFFRKIIRPDSAPPREAINIAMGSPTIESGGGTATLSPEFEAFLRHCQRNGLHHLYINNQNFIPKSVAEGDESVRCQTLHDAAERFPGALTVITLSQNSAFYKQKEKPGAPPASPAGAFKEELIQQLFDGDPHTTGNCIPKPLADPHQLRQWSQNTAEAIHKKLFGNRNELTAEERRIFIRLLYQNLSRHILVVTRATSYNASCKDRIDRGAATDAEEYAYLAILANKIQKPRVIEFFEMLIFARAIIVRKREIIWERLERLIETVKFMLDHRIALQELHRELFPAVAITIDQFEREE